MNQMTQGFDTKTLLFSRLMASVDSDAFSNFTMFMWDNEGDSGHAIVLQRYAYSEALVITFGTQASGDIFVEYWIRPGPALLVTPTPAEKLRQMTPVRIEHELQYLESAARYIVEVANSFHDSTFPSDKVIPIRGNRK